MKHTREPWECFRGYIIQKDGGEYGYQIAHVNHPVSDFPADEIEANANRIVECVNAMENIEDPKKLRETWGAIQELELDAYFKLKEKYDALILEFADINQLEPKDTRGIVNCFKIVKEKAYRIINNFNQSNP
jgi:hypothetical protein